MRAMMLAAGRGTRLGELGRSMPKILVDVGGEALLDRQLRYLARQGVDHVVINLHHLADQVLDHLRSHRPPPEVIPIFEEELLGTLAKVFELRRRHVFERMRERLGVRDEAVEDAARAGASEQLKCAFRWRRGALACPDSVACSDRRGGCPPLDDEIFEERFFLGWFLLDDEVLEKLRRAQRFAEAVACGEREVNRFRRAVEEELKEQSFFVAAVADFADAEEAAIGVGEKSVFDAALRKRVVLHAEDEEVIETS